MMTGVAHVVMESSAWTLSAVVLIAGFCLVSIHQTYVHIAGGNLTTLNTMLRQRAVLCLDKTGVVGAVLARHTLLVTLDLLVFNLSLNLLAAVRATDVQSMQATLLEYSLMTCATVCALLVVAIAVTTFALCNEVVRLAEERER